MKSRNIFKYGMAGWVGAVLCAGILAADSEAAVITQAVEYRAGSVTLEGYLAYDDAKTGPRPGIVVAHDWMGVGPYVKKRAEQLAALGYVALAADLYGKGVRPKDGKEAGALAGRYKGGDRGPLRDRMEAALAVIQARPDVQPGKIAAMGYCFGGTAALELFRSGAPLAGAVSFHGGLDTPRPAQAGGVKGKVLVCHGADDPFVKPADVTAFEEEMRAAGVDWQLIKYGGAVHSFTHPGAGSDPTKGAAYHPVADRRSWEAMKGFFEELFR